MCLEFLLDFTLAIMKAFDWQFSGSFLSIIIG